MLSSRATFPREAAGGDDDTGTAVQPAGFNTVGIQMAGNQARLLFGVAPFEPRVTVPLARVALSGDLADLVGYLKVSGASIDTLQVGTQLTASTVYAGDAYLDYLNATGADIVTLQNQSIDTESITTLGTPLYVDWFATDTDLPALALKNNPFQYKQNSDNSKSGFKIEDVFIGAAEGLAGDALMYLAKQGGGWLLNAAQAGLSMMNGYAAIGEAGLSLGADAASFGTAAAGDAAIFEAGAEGMVLASSASEAASLFSSAGVLAEGGVGFSSELGEVGEALLQGVENSSGSFIEEASPNFYDTLLGSARWVSL